MTDGKTKRQMERKTVRRNDELKDKRRKRRTAVSLTRTLLALAR